MAEKEDRQEGENYQSGRDGYKSYNNREGYNKYIGVTGEMDMNAVRDLIPIRMNVRSVLIAHAIIIKGKKAATARNARRMRPDIIRRKTENSVLTVRVITTVRKAKAATARNVLRTRPDIIRKRTVNNALTVRAITTVRRVKAAIVRHARTTPSIGRLWASARGASTYSRLQSECQIQQEETDGIQGGAG